MPRFLLLLICTFLFQSLPAQHRIPADSLYAFIKANSIHRKRADWPALDSRFRAGLGAAATSIDTIRAIAAVFEHLNDYHSSISYKGQFFTHYPSFDDSTLAYLVPLVQRSNRETGLFRAETLAGNLVYLRVPGVQAMGDDVSRFAQMLADTLGRYVNPKTRGIILDLRLNGGGQFSSMAAGLAPLLGDTAIAGGINADGVQTRSFHIRDGNVFLNGQAATAIRHKTASSAIRIPVALLIGPNTRSSGSILALSFKGRSKTVLIGEPTASGYTTGNHYLPFGRDLFLNLSTTHSLDRNNRVYEDAVPPDILLKGPDDFDAVGKDLKVQRAIRWLKENRK